MKSKRQQRQIKKVNKEQPDKDWFKRAEHFLLRVATLITLIITLVRVIIPEAQSLSKYIFSARSSTVIEEKARLTPNQTLNH